MTTNRTVTTAGGDYAEGNIDKRQGTFINTEEAYNVAGLSNPYLGLRAFSYVDRAKYAGRKKRLIEAVTRLVTPNAQHSLLFITGVSGSGKSSFVQAGLVPMLRAFYGQRGVETTYAVFRPSKQPLARLADALLQLGLPTEGVFAAASAYTSPLSIRATSSNHINLLVIDQFEELFTQSESHQRDSLIAILTSLPSFAQLRMHVIVTLRADFLPELFEYQALYEAAKQGIDLRAMSVEELEDAIQRPIQLVHPTKHFELTLLRRLSMEAADDATYLPLLQTTLDNLWRRGSLTLANYGTLTDAISKRADEVYLYTDYDTGCVKLRTEAECSVILAIFLALIEVSFDENVRRDVRRRRTAIELGRGDSNRIRLVNDLSAARLLSKGLEIREGNEVEVVDIIHETLLVNWDRLRLAIVAQRETLQKRTRFELGLQEWVTKRGDKLYLLKGIRLAEAEDLNYEGDVALHTRSAQEFLKRSITQRDSEQQRELVQQRAIAMEQRRRAETEQQRAEEQIASRQRLRWRAIWLTFALIIALFAMLAAAFFGVQASQNATEAQGQRQLAIQRERIARIGQLAAQAQAARASFPQRSLLLAAIAFSETLQPDIPSQPAAEQALRDSLTDVSGTVIGQLPGSVSKVAFSPDGHWMVAASAVTSSTGGAVRIWQIDTNGMIVTSYDLDIGNKNADQIVFAPNSRWLIATESVAQQSRPSTVWLWDLAQPLNITPVRSFTQKANASVPQFSPDSSWLLCINEDSKVQTLHLTDLREPTILNNAKDYFDFSMDNSFLITGSTDEMLLLWIRNDQGFVAPQPLAFPLDVSTVKGITEIKISPDSHWVAASNGTSVVLWHIGADAYTPPSVFPNNNGHGLLFSNTSDSLIVGSLMIKLGEDNVPTKYDSPLGLGIVATGFDSDDHWVIANAAWEGPISKILYDFSSSIVHTRSLGSWQGGGGEFSIANDWLAVPKDNTIALWNLHGHGRNINPFDTDPLELRGHEGLVQSIAFSSNSSWLISGGNDGMVRRWSLQIASAPSVNPEIISGDRVSMSPDGHWMATNNALYETISRISSLHQVEAFSTTQTLISPDSRWLLTTTPMELHRLDERRLPTIKLPVESTLCSKNCVFSPDGHWLVIGNLIWQLTNDGLQDIPEQLDDTSSPNIQAVFSLDTQWLAVMEDHEMRLWNIKDNKIIPNLFKMSLNSNDSSPSFSFDGHWMIILRREESNNHLQIYDLTRQSIQLPVIDLPNVFDWSLSPNNKWLILQQNNQSSKTLQLKLLAFNHTPESVEQYLLENADVLETAKFGDMVKSFSPDGHWVITRHAGKEGELLLWDLSSRVPKETAFHKVSTVDVVTFSPNGRWLAIGYLDGEIELSDLQHLNTLPVPLRSHTRPIGALTFSPDSHWLAAGDNFDPNAPILYVLGSATISLWNINDDQSTYVPLVLYNPEPTSYISGLYFTPDGRWLIATNVAQGIAAQVWPMQPQDMINAACRAAGRELNDTEWQQFFPSDTPRRSICSGSKSK